MGLAVWLIKYNLQGSGNTVSNVHLYKHSQNVIKYMVM